VLVPHVGMNEWSSLACLGILLRVFIRVESSFKVARTPPYPCAVGHAAPSLAVELALEVA